MKTILFLITVMVSQIGVAHSPGQLKKYYNYYQLANRYTQKKLSSNSSNKTKKLSLKMCQKITKKFNQDGVYFQACSAGVSDGLKKNITDLTEFENILHNTEAPVKDEIWD